MTDYQNDTIIKMTNNVTGQTWYGHFYDGLFVEMRKTQNRLNSLLDPVYSKEECKLVLADNKKYINPLRDSNGNKLPFVDNWVFERIFLVDRK